MSYIIIKISLFVLLCIVTLQNVAFIHRFSYDRSQTKKHYQPKRKTMMHHHQKQPSLLNFLYNNSVGKFLRSGLTKKWFSSMAGFYCDRSFSKRHISKFIHNNNINSAEAQKSIKEFTTFNDFFIRTLKPDARPIDHELLSITSPTDGHVMIFENSTSTMRFPIKESSFNLQQFLGNKEQAANYEGGTIMIFRLAPWDYHRFHFPIDCIPTKPYHINGRYESVNPLVYYSGIQPLTENERHSYLLKNNICDAITMVSVGALCVGKIIETYTPEKNYKKGDETGYFCFGGSTLVLIFKCNAIKVSLEILNNSKEGKETPIKMGQAIGTIVFNASPIDNDYFNENK